MHVYRGSDLAVSALRAPDLVQRLFSGPVLLPTPNAISGPLMLPDAERVFGTFPALDAERVFGTFLAPDAERAPSVGLPCAPFRWFRAFRRPALWRACRLHRRVAMWV